MREKLLSVDPVASYLQQRATELDNHYSGLSLPEIAALNDLSITFTSLETSRSKRISYEDDTTAEIIIDSSLPQTSQRREFMLWLVTVELERIGGE